MTRLATAFVAAALAAGMFGCGSGSNSPVGPSPPPTSGMPPSTPSPNGATVMATPSLVFTPDTVAVKVGSSVTFAFGSVVHNVFFDAANGAPADIGGANANVSVGRAFTTAGTYTYTCHIHPFMHGTVIVQ